MPPFHVLPCLWPCISKGWIVLDRKASKRLTRCHKNVVTHLQCRTEEPCKGQHDSQSPNTPPNLEVCRHTSGLHQPGFRFSMFLASRSKLNGDSHQVQIHSICAEVVGKLGRPDFRSMPPWPPYSQGKAAARTCLQGSSGQCRRSLLL